VLFLPQIFIEYIRVIPLNCRGAVSYSRFIYFFGVQMIALQFCLDTKVTNEVKSAPRESVGQKGLSRTPRSPSDRPRRTTGKNRGLQILSPVYPVAFLTFMRKSAMPFPTSWGHRFPGSCRGGSADRRRKDFRDYQSFRVRLFNSMIGLLCSK
jgi:hypothetical protein